MSNLRVDERTERVVRGILAHHGVLGMRWGQRKAARAEKDFAKIGTDVRRNFQKKLDLHNIAAEAANKYDVDRINNKPKWVKEAKKGTFKDENHPLTKQYFQEHQDAYLSRVREAAKAAGTSPSGTKEFTITPSESFLGWDLHVSEVKHVDATVQIKLITDSRGLLTKLEMVKDLAQADTYISEFLSHHGVLGMRWGVRRGQGTPTAATVTQRGKKLRGAGGKNQPPHPDAVKARTLGQQAKKSGVQSLSNQELQQFALRLNLEQSAKRVAIQDKPPVKRFIANLISGTAKTQVSNVANEAASAQVKKLLLKTAVAAA